MRRLGYGRLAMPEGHTIHRAARLHGKRFAGEVVAARSPQGRFSEGAARLDGQKLDRVDAHGKHLFYQWSDGDILHVHLGLFGRFRVFAEDPPPPTDGTRLAWTAETGTLYLAGATIVDLIGPEDREAIASRLGPDPLRRENNQAAEFARRLARRTISIGAALLDQKAVAGIGNVYRAELLFLTGIDPATPAKSVASKDVDRLWTETVRQLRLGEKSGRIITVEPSEVGASSRKDLLRDERLYVYKRDGLPCRRCGTEIEHTEMGGRTIWWCPSCQG